jgi:benzoyl-CoA reductase/2-hydroxyglutaryl-CoA dehydratase subunit BcrC/BadD/HgdB
MMENNTNGNKRLERIKKTTQVHLSMENKKMLTQLIDDFPYNPEGMYYFYERYQDYNNPENRELENEKVVATMCIYVPDELVYAAGAKPLRICHGSYSFDQAGSEFLPTKSCSLVKSVYGIVQTEMYPMGADPLMIINPTSCDQKKKLAEVSDNEKYYTLRLPPEKDSEVGRFYWQQSVNDFKKNLEKKTGKKITKKSLIEAIKKIAEAQKESRRLNDLRKGQPVIYGKDAILISNAYFFDDIDNWTKNLKKLNDELEERIAKEQFISNGSTPRIMLAGSPSIFPNMKLPVLVEKFGGIIVTDDFCSSNRLLYDTVAVDEWNLYDMIPAIGDRYLKPCTCPNLTPNNDRFRKIKQAVKDFKVEGIINQVFSGCQLFDMEAIRLSKELEKENIPVLNIETDYSPDDVGQLSTRIEAFLESLKSKKRSKQTA